MKKIIYIIPGWNESSQYKIYQSLATLAREKGYKVIFYDINWNKSLSSQIFSIEKNAIIFGFSLGAIFARLIAQRYKYRKIILASMTPYYSFKNKELKDRLVKLLGKKFIEDIHKEFRLKHSLHDQIIIYGDREKEQGDIIIPKTGHRLNIRYNKKIIELL